MSEINKRADFSFVRYAQCWEDADILLDALDVKPGGHYLSIASGGENSFSLLSKGASVTAVDLSRIQLAVTDLKRAAYATLDYQDFLAFLGVRPSRFRMRYYRQLRGLLALQHRVILDKQQSIVERGIIHSGKFERSFALFRKRVLPLTHNRRVIETLLQGSPDREQREQFYLSHWATARYKAMFKLFFSKSVMGKLGRDTEFFKYVEGSVADRILERVKTGLIEVDARTNPYLQYILTGGYGDALPHALREENYEAIKQNLHNLTLKEAPLDKYVASLPDESVAGYNLSDIFEYMTQEQMDTLYRLLLDKAAPGGRMAYWNMLVPRSASPQLFGQQVQSHDTLAAQLLLQDKAFFYSRFVIEEKR